jgi:hypothetical protein
MKGTVSRDPVETTIVALFHIFKAVPNKWFHKLSNISGQWQAIIGTPGKNIQKFRGIW